MNAVDINRWHAGVEDEEDHDASAEPGCHLLDNLAGHPGRDRCGGRRKAANPRR